MHADTINLLSSGGTFYADVYKFPAGSNYVPYYGTRYLYAYNYDYNGFSQLEALGGTTTGSLTKFSYAYQWTPDGAGALSNAAFNANTDVVTGTFALNGKTWHLRETFSPTYTFAYNYGGWSYSAYSANVTSATLTTPEPSTLGLLGTGLFMIGGMARKRLVGPQSYSI
jgi:hypothetical protein